MHLKALYSVRPVTHLNNHQCSENAQIFTVQSFIFLLKRIRPHYRHSSQLWGPLWPHPYGTNCYVRKTFCKNNLFWRPAPERGPRFTGGPLWSLYCQSCRDKKGLFWASPLINWFKIGLPLLFPVIFWPAQIVWWAHTRPVALMGVAVGLGWALCANGVALLC